MRPIVVGAARPAGEAQPAGRPVPRAALSRWTLLLIAGVNRLVPKLPGKVLLHSVPDFEDNVLALIDELSHRGRRCVVLLDGDVAGPALAGRGRGSVVVARKTSLLGLYHYCTSQFVITTHGFFGSFAPAKSQVVVNVWHGELTKPVARFDGQPAVRSTYATVTSPVGRAFRCAEFGLHPDQVLVLGAARNDRMLSTDGSQVQAALLPDHPGAKVLLWLPTYRAAVRGQRRVDGGTAADLLPLTEDELDLLDAFLERHGAVLLVKPHPLAKQQASSQRSRIRVVNGDDLVSAGISLYNLLAAADCLVTDVSSVWIDYLLLDRPIVCMFPDIAVYRATRGLLLEPYEHWIPAPVVTDLTGLVAALDAAIGGRDEHAASRREMAARLHTYQDACSTGRLLDALDLV